MEEEELAEVRKERRLSSARRLSRGAFSLAFRILFDPNASLSLRY